MPSALSTTYCTEEDIWADLSFDGEQGRLDDDGSGTGTSTNVVLAKVRAVLQSFGFTLAQALAAAVTANQTLPVWVRSHFSAQDQADYTEQDVAAALDSLTQWNAYLVKGIAWATDRINFYLEGLYTRADLASSWVVNDWCTILAVHWLSLRRGNPVPGSLGDLYKATIEDLKLVKSGEYQLPGIGYRNNMWPAWSNIRVDTLYSLRKVRVERPISEGTPLPGRRNRDIPSDFIIEPS